MQTPKFSRTYTTLRWTCIILFAIVVVLALIVLVPLFVERVDQWSGWKSGEWAAAGAWIGGIGATTAVIVALWQTKLARSDAAEANSRLDHQLQTASRLEQIKTIPPIWDAIRTLSTPTTNLIIAFSKMNERINDRDAAEEDLTRADFEIVHNTANIWKETFTAVESSFSPALMIIEEEKTRIIIATLYQRVIKLHMIAITALKGFPEWERCDPKEIQREYERVNAMRTPVVNTVRKHLMEIPPLTSLVEDFTDEDLTKATTYAAKRQ